MTLTLNISETLGRSPFHLLCGNDDKPTSPGVFPKKLFRLSGSLLKSTVPKHRVFIFSCEQDEEPCVHIVVVSFLEKGLSLWDELYLTGIFLSAAVMHLIL